MAMNETLQQELIKDLLLESHEGLDRFDRELLALEQGQSGRDSMNNIFRVIHTLKGTAGCLGLGHIEHTAHAGEDLLSLLRDGKLQTSPEMITALLALSDALRGMLRTLEATGNDGTADHSALLAQLQQLQTLPVTRTVAAASATAEKPTFGLFDEEEPGDAAPLSPAPSPAAAPTVVPPVSALASEPAATAATNEIAAKSGVADNAIRVDISQLDKVMNLVGELVLSLIHI